MQPEEQGYPDWTRPYYGGSTRAEFNRFAANQGRYDLTPYSGGQFGGSDIPESGYGQIPEGGSVALAQTTTPFESVTRTISDPAPPETTPAVYDVPTIDESRAIVSDFYNRILGRAPDASGWQFWTDSFRNEITTFQRDRGMTYASSVSLALADLEAAFSAAVGADYEKPFHPLSLLDSYNASFGGGVPTTKPSSGDFVVVPQQLESGNGGNTKLFVILAVVGIIVTIGAHYYFKHHG